MTDAFVNTLFGAQKAIGSLFSAVKTAREQQQRALTFVYRYTSIQDSTLNKVYGAGILWQFYLVSLQMAGFGTYAQNIISTNQVTLNDGTVISLDAVDLEILILLAQSNLIGNLFRAPFIAQNYIGEGKTYFFPVQGLHDLSGNALPYIAYGGRTLVQKGNANLGSAYGFNETL